MSQTAPVVFTFSEAMDPSTTKVEFIDVTAPLAGSLPTTISWDATNTRMTNTPVPPFPAGRVIGWSVDGRTPNGEAVGGDAGSYFTTASDAGTSDCTNTVGSITLAKAAFYQQTSDTAPVLDIHNPYAFVAYSALACSDWNTTNISLTLPLAGGVTNLPNEAIAGHYNLTTAFTNLASLESSFPDGGFVFNLQFPFGVTALPMSLPDTIEFPLPAPQVTNYAAAQAINPAQAFVLGWDGAAETVDCVYVEVYGVFTTPALGQSGALTGAARTVTIPPNTLNSNMTYAGTITFYHTVLTTNDYVTLAYRATTTEFSLTTTGTPLLITNQSVLGGNFSFDVISSAGQAMIVETCTNLVSGQWKTLLVTNGPPTGWVHVSDPLVRAHGGLFYRAIPAASTTLVIDSTRGANITNLLKTLTSNTRVIIRGNFTWPNIPLYPDNTGHAQVELHDLTNVSFIGAGQPQIKCTGDGFGIIVSNVSNFHWEGITLIGDCSLPQGTNGSAALGFKGLNYGVFLIGNVFSNWVNQGVSMGGYDAIPFNTHHVLIKRNQFYNIGSTNMQYLGNVPDGTCMSGFYGSDVWVLNNYASNCLRFLEVEPWGHPTWDSQCTDHHFLSNTCVEQLGWYIIHAATAAGAKCNNIEIRGNYFESTTRPQYWADGIGVEYVAGGTNILIEGNVFKNLRPTIGIFGTITVAASGTNSMDNVVIRSNTFIHDQGWHPIEIMASGPVTVAGHSAVALGNLFIQDNLFDGTGGPSQSTIRSGAANVWIERNTFRNAMQGAYSTVIALVNGFDSQMGAYVGRTTNAWVRGNTVTSMGVAPGNYFLFNLVSEPEIPIENLYFEDNDLDPVSAILPVGNTILEQYPTRNLVITRH